MANYKFFLTLVGGLILMSALAKGEKCSDGETEYTCVGWGTKISCTRACDGMTDCPDGSEELKCPCNDNYPQFKCNDGTCIPKSYACDNFIDCEYGEDENKDNCDSYTCWDGTIISATMKCDGKMNCGWGEDEMYCNCGGNHTYQCNEEYDWCMLGDYHCDGYWDCPNGNDETMCPCDEIYYTFQCDEKDEYSCMPEDYVCDGWDDCEYGEDEPDECKPPAVKNERSGKRSVGMQIRDGRIRNGMNKRRQ